MTISAVSSANVLSDLYASGKIGDSKSANSPSLNEHALTISQIRDQVDKLATTGQLTSLQQVALLASGFQDYNAGDASYQPEQQMGYTRATTGTFDSTGTLQAIGDFDAAHGDRTDAARLNGLANYFKQDRFSNPVGATVELVKQDQVSSQTYVTR